MPSVRPERYGGAHAVEPVTAGQISVEAYRWMLDSSTADIGCCCCARRSGATTWPRFSPGLPVPSRPYSRCVGRPAFIDSSDLGMSPSPVVAIALTAEHPSPQSLRRLEHEYSLAGEPLSNLMASGQIHRADRIRVTHREGSRLLKFHPRR